MVKMLWPCTTVFLAGLEVGSEGHMGWANGVAEDVSRPRDPHRYDPPVSVEYVEREAARRVRNALVYGVINSVRNLVVTGAVKL